MASYSEATFGQRLEKGNNILIIIQNMPNYQPTNQDISIIGFKNLVVDINTLNNNLMSNQDVLSQTRNARTESYFGQNGLKELSGMIRDYIGSLPGGKTTIVYKNMQKEVAKLKGYKKAKTKTTDETSTKSISKSEQSFGSLIQSGKNILSMIQNINNYSPSNPNITVQGFQTIINNIETLNNTVQEKLIIVSNGISQRKEMYEGDNGLRKRIQMIKNYVSSTFGKSSQEYKNVMSIKY